MRIIDADALINAIFDHCRSESEIKNHFFYDENIIAIIFNAPTVELDESVIQEVLNKRCMTAVANEYLIALHGSSKRPHGTWIERTDRITLNTYYECSNCNEPWTTIEGTPWDNGMNFCPYCGAFMKGSDNE